MIPRSFREFRHSMLGFQERAVLRIPEARRAHIFSQGGRYLSTGRYVSFRLPDIT